MKNIFLAVFAQSAAVLAAFAQMYFVGNTDKDALKYKSGEDMNFEIQLFDEDGGPKIGQTVEWIITSDDGAETRKGKAITSKSPLKLSAKCNNPGFVRVQVYALDENGKRVKYKAGHRQKTVAFCGGAGADVEKIKTSGAEPADFDAFWQAELCALDKIPVEGKMEFSETLSTKDFDLYALTIPTLEKPARAWLSIPKNAAAKSLPIDISVYGYGVGRELPNMPKNAIGLHIARHSCQLMGSPQYYDDLKKGELRGFGLSAKINKNPKDCYFKFMVLRDYRTLAWVKKNVAQWDGKHITVHGSSMGGFRSIFLSYLDGDITECRPNVPWMTDLWASDLDPKRQKCEFKPEWIETIRYFDSTLAVKRVKCPVVITAWLGDYVCPPAGIMALYNNANKNASIDFGQNGVHSGAVAKPETCRHYSLKK